MSMQDIDNPVINEKKESDSGETKNKQMFCIDFTRKGGDLIGFLD